MFHGVGDNSAVMWLPNIKELSENFYCIAVDTIGGPGKSIPNENYNKQFDQVVWINEVIDDIDIKGINIVGISYGAYMAYNYFVKRPDIIRKVVCLEGGMALDSGKIKAILNVFKILFPEMLIPTKKNIIKVLSKIAYPNSDLFNKYPEAIEHMIMVMKCFNKSAMFYHNKDMYSKEEVLDIKDRIFFILGELKIFHSEELISTLKADAFHYKVINKSGHAINFEQPGKVCEEIIYFINN
jgi:pimeloyl-ACP methyl ester carboxylesterase